MHRGATAGERLEIQHVAMAGGLDTQRDLTQMTSSNRIPLDPPVGLHNLSRSCCILDRIHRFVWVTDVYPPKAAAG